MPNFLQVTLALYFIGAIKGVRAIACFVAQIIGSIAASAVASAILPGALNIATSLGPNVSIAQGCFLEMFLTCELVLAILFLAAEKHKATFLLLSVLVWPCSLPKWQVYSIQEDHSTQQEVSVLLLLSGYGLDIIGFIGSVHYLAVFLLLDSTNS